MSFVISAQQNRNEQATMTLNDNSGNQIVVGAGDVLHVTIRGNGDQLTFDSGATTANGSSITAANPATINFNSADLAFSSGVYEIVIDHTPTAGDRQELSTGSFLLSGDPMIVNDGEVKTALGNLGAALTDPQMATLLTFLPGVVSAVRVLIGYDPSHKVGRVEYLPKTEDRFTDEFIHVTHLPLRESAVNVDGNARFGRPVGSHAAADLVEGTDYFVEYDGGEASVSLSGALIRNNEDWCNKTGTIRVTYESGYTVAELNGDVNAPTGLNASGIKTAILLTMKDVFATIFRQSGTSGGSASSASSGTTLMTGAVAAGVIESEKAGDYAVKYHVDTDSVARLELGTVQLTAEAVGYLEPFVSYSRIGQ